MGFNLLSVVTNDPGPSCAFWPFVYLGEMELSRFWTHFIVESWVFLLYLHVMSSTCRTPSTGRGVPVTWSFCLHSAQNDAGGPSFSSRFPGPGMAPGRSRDSFLQAFAEQSCG